MDVRRWIEETPPVTLAVSILSCTLSSLLYFKFMNTSDVAFIFPRILDGEVWRTLTGLLYPCPWDLMGQAGISSGWLESKFYKNSAKFLYRLLLLCLGSLAASYMLNLSKPAVVLNFSLIHIRYMRDQQNTVFGMTNLEVFAVFFPLARDILLRRGEGMCSLYGMLLGQLLIISEDVVSVWDEVPVSKLIDAKE